ncbi:MAG: hypothetical protein GY751_15110, partial [Bacteroidetes bacterium]|nr:hypothetical protein [Bacteroidota bacterium]
ISVSSSDDGSVVPNDKGHINIDGFGTEHTVTLDQKDNNYTIEHLVITPAPTIPPTYGGWETLITVTVDDGSGTETAIGTETFYLIVNDNNDPPIITGIKPETTLEDTPKTLIYTVTDVEGSENMTLEISTEGDSKTIVPNEDENIDIDGFGLIYPFSLSPNQSFDIPVTITPAKDEYGTAKITVTVSDGIESAPPKTFLFRVNQVNDKPEILELQNYETKQDEPIDVPFKLKDMEGGEISISVTSGNPEKIDHIKLGNYGSSHTYTLEKGKLSDQYTMTITPAVGEFGTTKIFVTADDNSETDTAVNDEEFFTLTIGDKNDPPVFSYIDPNQTTPEDETKEISFTVTDAEGGTFPITIDVESMSPTDLIPLPIDVEHVSINDFYPSYTLSNMDPGQVANLVLKITPKENKSGTAEITITAEDGESDATAKFVLKVESGNDAPTIEPISNIDISEGENTGIIPINVTDLEGGDITVSVTSSKPSVVDYDNIDIDDHTKYLAAGEETAFNMIITPADGESSGDKPISIIVTATDGTMTSEAETFELIIYPTNSEPEIDYIGNKTIDEDEPLEFTIKISDDEGETTLPVSVSVSASTDLVKNSGISIEGYGSPYDITGMQPGETELTLKIIPEANESGTTEVTVKVVDGDHEVTRSFQLKVDPVNDEPIIPQITDQYYKEPPENIVEFSVNDFEGGSMAVSAISLTPELIPNTNYNINIDGFGSSRMQTIPAGNAEKKFNLELTPVAGKNGAADITITVTDGTGDDAVTQDMTFTYKVGLDAINQAPEIESITFDPAPITNEDFPVTAYVTISDPDGGDLTISATSDKSTLFPNDNIDFDDGYGQEHTFHLDPAQISTRMLTLTPAENMSGSEMITVKIYDGKLEDSKSFEIKVNSLNDKPVIASIPNQKPPLGEIDINITDVEGGEMVIEVTSSNADLVPNSDNNINISGYGSIHTTSVLTHKLTLTPVSDTPGLSTLITVKVTDGDNIVTMPFTFSIDDDLDTPPEISFIQHQETKEDKPIVINFTVTDKEVGGLIVTVESDEDGEDIVPNSYKNLAIKGFMEYNVTLFSPGQVVELPLTITPAADKSGPAKITVTVDDTNNDPVSSVFQLMVKPENDPPEISAIGNYVKDENNPDVNVEFTVTDKEGGQVTLSVSSDNESMVPDSAINIDSNFGNIHTLSLEEGKPKTVNLKITPVPGQQSQDQTITANIRVEVDDQGEIAEEFFPLMVGDNEPPMITAKLLEVIDENEETYFNFNVSDKEGGQLLVSVISGDEKLVPNEYAHINIYGPDSDPDEGSATKYELDLPKNGSDDLQVRLKPAINESGDAEMTIRVKDGDKVVEKIFTLAVKDIPVPPKISVEPLQVTNEDIEKVISITVSDDDDSVQNLVVTHEVVSDSNNVIGTVKHSGTGANRILNIKPTANRFGEAEIRVTVSDGTSTDEEIFTFKVNSVNDEPTISPISPTMYAQVNTPRDVKFTINDNDVETPANQLIVTLDQDDPNSVIKELALSGASAERVLTITPANKTGVADILINVDDGSANSKVTFTLIVTDPLIIGDNPPIIEGITTPRFTNEDKVFTMDFTVDDIDTPVEDLTLTAISYNLDVVSSDKIVVEGFGKNYTLKITPELNKFGIAPIKIIVNDKKTDTWANFDLEVQSINDEPIINGLPSEKQVDENEEFNVSFTVGDVETAFANLKVSALSFNPNLIRVDDMSLSHDANYMKYYLNFERIMQSGRAIISISVIDENSGITTKSFVLTVGTVQDGDIDNNGTLDLADAIIVLKILTGVQVADINMGADVNEDQKIGIHELYYILRYLAVSQ